MPVCMRLRSLVSFWNSGIEVGCTRLRQSFLDFITASLAAAEEARVCLIEDWSCLDASRKKRLMLLRQWAVATRCFLHFWFLRHFKENESVVQIALFINYFVKFRSWKGLPSCNFKQLTKILMQIVFIIIFSFFHTEMTTMGVKPSVPKYEALCPSVCLPVCLPVCHSQCYSICSKI